jgi:bifunctional DNase/RNase
MRAQLLGFAIALAAGCGGSAPPPPPPPVPVTAEPPPDPVVKPEGYVEVHPMQVVELGESAALLLVDEASSLVVPIFIGGTEGQSIVHRLSGTTPPRPLTHDLLDAAVKKLHGSIVKVHVDALRDGIYYGSIYIRSGRRVLRLDARPSDAIALALGNRAPIYISQQVLDAAGVPRDELLKQLPVSD